MNYSAVPRGQAMQQESTFVRLAKLDHPGSPRGDRKLSTSDIPRIRRLLRTEISIEQMAEEFGTSGRTLRCFIKRRAICNLKARMQFIKQQTSLSKLPEP